MTKFVLNSAEAYALRTALRDVLLLSERESFHAAAESARARIPNPGLVLSEVRSDGKGEKSCEIELAGREAAPAIISLQELRDTSEREYARLRALAGRLLERAVPKRVLEEA